MSNLKKYLKVYSEDAQNKKAFEQYMRVISENQDFFTRHEVNEFFTDMIKDGTLVYDEGWREWIIAFTTAAVMTSAGTSGKLHANEMQKYLDGKIEKASQEMIIKTKSDSIKSRIDMEKYNELKTNGNFIQKAITNNAITKDTVPVKGLSIPSLKKLNKECNDLVDFAVKNETNTMQKNGIKLQKDVIDDAIKDAISNKVNFFKKHSKDFKENIKDSNSLKDFVGKTKSDVVELKELTLIGAKNYQDLKDGKIDFDQCIDNYVNANYVD